MPAPPPRPLDELLRQAQKGDGPALEELIRRYEPRLRLAARSLLRPELRHYLDSIDLIQSVHRALMPGLRNGRYHFDDEDRLIALAVTVLRNKVHRAARRAAGSPASSEPTGEPTPSQVVTARDLYAHILADLEPQDRRLVEMRCQDFTMAEIAVELNSTAAILRARLTRLRRKLRDAGYDDWL